MIWGFPKVRDTSMGVTIIRNIISWGLYWGPIILGKNHIEKFVVARLAEGCLTRLIPCDWTGSHPWDTGVATRCAHT